MHESRTLRRALIASTAALCLIGVAAVGSPVRAEDPFIAGSGRADAKILRMGPSAGRLSFAPTIGLTLADYVGTLGRGESRTADYAALDGSVPDSFRSQLPTVRAESTDDDAGTTKSAGFASSPSSSPIYVGGSEQTATATKEPTGSSTYTFGAYRLPGVFEVGGSTATARAGIVAGKTREAVGTTKISNISLGGGVVSLTGLTWEAVQRTGAGAGTSATFRIDGVTIGAGPLAQKLTVPDGGQNLAAVLGPINTALAPSGLQVVLPSTSTEGGLARVGPLSVQMADSQVGRAALGPVLAAVQPIRDPITGALINANAEFSTAVLLADVAVGVFSGAGRNDIEFGGASAYTEGERFDNPFGAFSLGTFTPPESGGTSFDLPSATVPSSDTFVPDAVPSTPLDAPTQAAPLPAPAADAGAGGTAAPVASTRTVAGHRGGIAFWIGMFGLLAALGVAYADYRRIRSTRRTIVVS